ncbi:MAG: secretin N-terminal domain-containing protein [Acidobacteriota bacterium]
MSSAPRKPLAFTLLALALLVAGCRGSKHFQAGERAERVGRYDEAVSYYLRAVTEDPDNLHYRKSFERAKLRASAAHALEAARLLAAEEPKAALKEMELALSLNPTDGHLAEELEKLQAAVREKDEKAALTSIAALKEQAREKPLGRLRTTPGAEQPAGFIFRDASLRDVLLSVAKMAGVNVVFDSDFIDRRISIELRETTFEEALRSLCRITQNFFRVQEDHIVTIIPDTPAKRRAYQQQVMKTFYLSTADVKETIDLLRIVLGARRVAPLTASNAITMVDTPEKVAAAERIITVLDKSQAEVVVEVELLEVNRSRLTEYGIQFRSAGSEGIRAAVAPGDVTLDDSPYPRANLFATGLPGALLTLLRTDSETRVLANPQLRAVAGETAQAEFGERVPIPVTTLPLWPRAASSSNRSRPFSTRTWV